MILDHIKDRECNCKLCRQWRYVDEVIASRDVDRLIELVRQQENYICNIGEELEMLKLSNGLEAK